MVSDIASSQKNQLEFGDDLPRCWGTMIFQSLGRFASLLGRPCKPPPIRYALLEHRAFFKGGGKP